VLLNSGTDYSFSATDAGGVPGNYLAGGGSAAVTIETPYQLKIEFSGSDVGVGTGQLKILRAALLESPQLSGTQVDFTFNDGNGGNADLSVSGWDVNPSVVASDPITVWNGARTQFWIPADTYTTLLEAPDVSILAKPLTGPTADLQWFDRLRITAPGGKLIAEVSTVRELRSVDPQDAFGEQITVDFGRSIQVQAYDGATLFSTSDGKVKGAAYRQPYHLARTHGKNEIEHVHIETPSISFNIYASHAGVEFPEDMALQLKYVHLDFAITSSTVPAAAFTGVLPELWEVIPRSQEVQAMLVPPSQAGAKLCKS